MPVNYPTVEDVKKAFAAVIHSPTPFDQARWHELFSRATDTQAAPWEKHDGIEVLHAGEARLVRVDWKFEIDSMNTSSESTLRLAIADLKQRLSQLSDGQPMSFGEIEIAEETTTVIRCLTRGIIG